MSRKIRICAHVLHWIEAMSSMVKTYEVIKSMALLEMMIKVSLLTLIVSPGAMFSVAETDMKLGRKVCESPCCDLRCEAVSNVRETLDREGTTADICFSCTVYTLADYRMSAVLDDNTR
jgi:hypothetical protein